MWGQELPNTTRGVLARTERHGKTWSLLAVADVANANDAKLGSSLEPTTRRSFGATEVLLTTNAGNSAGEQFERSSMIDVRIVAKGDLKWAGMMVTERQSNGVFWGGPWRWSMTSAGVPEGTRRIPRARTLDLRGPQNEEADRA